MSRIPQNISDITFIPDALIIYGQFFIYLLSGLRILFLYNSIKKAFPYWDSDDNKDGMKTIKTIKKRAILRPKITRINPYTKDEKTPEGIKTEDLIKVFFKEIVKSRKDKYFFIIGKAGSGKTTASIQLAYKLKKRFRAINRNIVVLPFRCGSSKSGGNDILDRLPNENINKTILILDALEEDQTVYNGPNALKTRVDKIYDKTRGFKRVIITVRYELFRQIEDEPNGVIKARGNEYVSTYRMKPIKYYIPNLSINDIDCYIKKSFPFSLSKRKRFKELVDANENLISVPFVLQEFKKFTKDKAFNSKFEYEYQIYEAIMDRNITIDVNKMASSFLNQNKIDDTEKTDIEHYSNALMNIIGALLDIYLDENSRYTTVINSRQLESILGYDNHILNSFLKNSHIIERIGNEYSFGHLTMYEHLLAKYYNSDIDKYDVENTRILLYSLTTFRKHYIEKLLIKTKQLNGIISLDYADTQSNLGYAYRILAEIENVKENCIKAIEHYNNALVFFTKEKYLSENAHIQSYIGNAYLSLSNI